MADLNDTLLYDGAKSKVEGRLPPAADKPRMMAFLRPAAQAIAFAINEWRRAATLSNVNINGAIATGGTVAGPRIERFVIDRMTPGFDPLTGALAKGLADRWEEFQRKMTVPGLPWYPMFQYPPMPVMPPTANMPSTMIPLCGAGFRVIESQALGTALGACLPNNAPPGARETLAGLAHGVEKAVHPFLAGTLVTNVMGKGSSVRGLIVVGHAGWGPVAGGKGEMRPGGFR